MTYEKALAEFRFWYYHAVLVEKRGNITRAARAAGRNRTEFYRSIARAGFELQDLQSLRVGHVDVSLGGVSQSA